MSPGLHPPGYRVLSRGEGGNVIPAFSPGCRGGESPPLEPHQSPQTTPYSHQDMKINTVNRASSGEGGSTTMGCLAALCRQAGTAPWSLGSDKLFGYPQGISPAPLLQDAHSISGPGAALPRGRGLSFHHQQLLFAKAVLKNSSHPLFLLSLKVVSLLLVACRALQTLCSQGR